MLAKKRLAFTMIELIFVIVILGVLSAVAIPKLAATRNDAKVVQEVMGVAIALENLGAEYTAKGSFVNYDVSNANDEVNCFEFTLNDANDGNISLAMLGVSVSCPASVRAAVLVRAVNKGMVNNGGTAKTYLLGGVGITE